MRRSGQILFYLLSGLLVASPGLAQTRLSTANGNSLAYNCFASAMNSTKGQQVSSENIDSCTAALNGGLSAKDRAATYDNRGVVYDAHRDYAEALSDYDTSINMNPTVGDAWINRGAVLIRLNRIQEALDDLNHGISLGPSLPAAGYYDRAIAEFDLGDVKNSYADFKRAATANPDFAAANEALKHFTVTSD